MRFIEVKELEKLKVDVADQVHFDPKAFTKNLTQRPGVYKMLDKNDNVIYIGKAKNLKKRVSSYFRSGSVSPKHQVLVSQICAMEVLVTHTEGEALLLESQLIKRNKPRYNITLRDDKSYPYIYVSTHQDFPRVAFHRGAKRKQGQYFGPYPSAGSVRESLKLLQKVIPVRQCDDSYFRNRSRPCLQYQIKRCTAPCVNFVTPEVYRQDVNDTLLFLEGHSDRLIEGLIDRMEHSAKALEFEQAAHYRDQITTLRSVLEKQFVSRGTGDTDIISCASKAGIACIQVVFIRNGQHIGNKAFFPKMPEAQTADKVLQAFIPQYYLGKKIPSQILVNHELKNPILLEEVLGEEAQHKVRIQHNPRGDRLKWIKMAETNAENVLGARLANKQHLHGRFLSLKEEMGCDDQPKRLECFDISHIQGDQTVASCVVFDQDGPVKSAYRLFNISGIRRNDDYAALAQAVTRRFTRIKKGEYHAPDILFIDGGKGQVNAVKKALTNLEFDNMMIAGIAKGHDRKAGMESIFIAGDTHPIILAPDSPALLLVQHIRDEAHRFAITSHRQQRKRSKSKSVLEAIDGLGPKRRQLLLKQFGGLGGIKKAGVDDLASLQGISRCLAQRIYDNFHEA